MNNDRFSQWAKRPLQKIDSKMCSHNIYNVKGDGMFSCVICKHSLCKKCCYVNFYIDGIGVFCNLCSEKWVLLCQLE